MCPLAMPEVDVGTSILEELDWSPACEWLTIEDDGRLCDRAAQWSGLFPCCGFLILCCNEHREVLDRRIKTFGQPMHLRCKHVIEQDMRWERL